MPKDNLKSISESINELKDKAEIDAFIQSGPTIQDIIKGKEKNLVQSNAEWAAKITDKSLNSVEIENPVKQVKNKPLRNTKGQLLPGQSGNPNGRPKGKTLKEYQAEKFRNMTDDERETYLKEINKIDRWKMAEGLPRQDADITSGGEPIQPTQIFIPQPFESNE